MELLGNVISPTIEGLSIVFMGENFDGEDGLPTIRVLLGLLNSTSKKYEIEKELEAFSFMTLNEALAFYTNLPNMSALELILAMSSVDTKAI